MHIALHNADNTAFPNLALLKLSAWHKLHGDIVTKYIPLMPYDKIYSSQVFTWTKQNIYLPDTAIKGGTGYGIMNTLSDEIEHTCPDYDFAGINYSLGFLTRGCIRSCSWCIVPQKEGELRPHADIEEFARHRDVVLMDNNVLAHIYGIEQIDKIIHLGLRVDFNQGLDARLVDYNIAMRLNKLRWIKYIRFSCDTTAQMKTLVMAISLLRKVGCKKEIFSYVLVKDLEDALQRINFLSSIKVTPFAQPYRNFIGTEPTREQKYLARWCNRAWIRKTCNFENYAPYQKLINAG
jgi:hypothetical protein